MKTEVDVNHEFEKIFGSIKPVNLFDTDEENDSIRQFILNQPHEEKKGVRKLPFSGISLVPYNEFMWNNSIQDALERGQRVFYIKQDQPFCRAAGYYDADKDSFFILKYSYVVSTFIGTFDYLLRLGRNKLLKNRSEEDGQGLFLTETIKLSSPLISATYVLGVKASVSEWCDMKGKSIVSFYPRLAELLANEYKEEDRKDEEGRLQAKKIIELLNGIKNFIQERENRHIFYLDESGLEACGYLDANSKLFYILKGSTVSANADIVFSNSPLGKARLRLLDKACKRNGSSITVIRDAKCRSASAAASYVLGINANYLKWKDQDGKSLEDIYPERFYSSKVQSAAQMTIKFAMDEPVLFHIVDASFNNRYCKAYGTYDSVGKKFLLQKGSVLSLEVTSSYRYTASEIQRQKFIKLNCTKATNGYVLKRDAICDSPDIAASFVIGKAANGWNEWKDDSNRRLIDVYSKD